MKRIMLSLLVTLIVFSTFGQDKETLKTQLRNTNLVPGDQPLLWIKTGQDFPQEDLSTEQIDKK